MVFGRITELKSASKLLVIDKIIISKAAIMGPMYGIRFNNEHKNAIMKEADHAKVLHSTIVKIDLILKDYVKFE